MIDVIVARDKLAGFETADEIAQFFTDQGIKALMGNATSCAISIWMQQITGDTSIVTTWGCIGYGNEPDGSIRYILHNTEAMSDFVSKFDRAGYPALIGG